MKTNYRDGAVTITLTGDLERWARQVVSGATQDAVKVAERELEPLAVRASAEWYGAQGVHKETGKGGQIEVVTTIDVTRGIVTTTIGSADSRTEGSRPVPFRQHRPGRLSTVLKKVSRQEYWSTPEALRGPYPMIRVRNDKAGDGKFLMQEFVIRPGRLLVAQRIAPAVVAALKTRVESGGIR